MKYALLIYDDEKAWAAASERERSELIAEHGRLFERLQADNAFVAGEPLEPSATATTVRTEAGRSIVSPGPPSERNEQLGGFYLIDATDLEAAVAYAKTLSGTVEIRAVAKFAMVEG